MKRIVITNIKDKDFLYLFDEDHECSLIKCIDNSIVDNIYLANITEINKGIRAAFAQIGPDKKIFIPIKSSKPVKCTDKIPVQIKADAQKGKLPEGSLDICLPGQYVVCHMEYSTLSVSRKLEDSVRNQIYDIVSNSGLESLSKYGYVIRTNSEFLLEKNDFEPLYNEIISFGKLMDFILEQGIHRPVFSSLYVSSSNVLNCINDIPMDEYDEIITDNREYYDELVSGGLQESKKIRLYEDPYISLRNLHSLETYLNRAIDRKVFLDCGGYIVIDHTEAMTVIDVNSGKADSKKKDSSEFYYKVNKQAALEIAKQLKIRNISGIIVVDFINMKSSEDNQKLLDVLKSVCGQDKVATTVVDMTPLGLVEITRKKINLSLEEAMNKCIDTDD